MPYQKKDWWLGLCQYFSWYDKDKDIKRPGFATHNSLRFHWHSIEFRMEERSSCNGKISGEKCDLLNICANAQQTETEFVHVI